MCTQVRVVARQRGGAHIYGSRLSARLDRVAAAGRAPTRTEQRETGMAREVDADFRALPLDALADAALQRARDLGVQHADLRVERVRDGRVRLRDGQLAGGGDATDSG